MQLYSKYIGLYTSASFASHTKQELLFNLILPSEEANSRSLNSSMPSQGFEVTTLLFLEKKWPVCSCAVSTFGSHTWNSALSPLPPLVLFLQH